MTASCYAAPCILVEIDLRRFLFLVLRKLWIRSFGCHVSQYSVIFFSCKIMITQYYNNFMLLNPGDSMLLRNVGIYLWVDTSSKTAEYNFHRCDNLISYLSLFYRVFVPYVNTQNINGIQQSLGNISIHYRRGTRFKIYATLRTVILGEPWTWVALL